MKRWSLVPMGLVAVVAALIAGSLLAGCASGTATMPDLKTGVTVHQTAHRATIHVAASGVGEAFSGIVVTYPDGHRDLLGTATYSDGDSSKWRVDNLTAGTYGYAVYAIPAGSGNSGAFPVGEIADQNLMASGTFTIR